MKLIIILLSAIYYFNINKKEWEILMIMLYLNIVITKLLTALSLECTILDCNRD